MTNFLNIKKRAQDLMHAHRIRLARPDALLHLALLGLITGFLAGGAIVLFRLLVESTQIFFVVGDDPDNYESLSMGVRFFLPIITSIFIALMFYRSAKGIKVLGISRVLERMEYHQGYLSVREFCLQFVGSALAIIGGHSVGREGPHVHLGAASGSIFGQWLKLPNNSIRTLVASGAAAGISASFNTPLAGVVFALEVIMMEYSLASFVPIMLASVSADALSVAVLGNKPAFVIPEIAFSSFHELPFLFILGVAIGTSAALFNHTLSFISSKTQTIEIWWRVILAGLIIALMGLFFPEILGIGYDTVNKALLGEFSFVILLSLALAKLIASSVSVGMGIPGGMIGPAFFIGATLGGGVGYLATTFFGYDPSNIGFFALLGMGAMMGASLQAPLAALTAVMELTYNPGVIMPGMLTIVIAQLTTSEIFGKQSLFIQMLRSNGLDFDTSPVVQVLRGIGVASVLNNNTVRLSKVTSFERVNNIVSSKSMDVDWILLNDKNDKLTMLMPISELAKYLKSEEMLEKDDDEPEVNQPESIDLLEIPARRLQLSPISLQSNLQQAHEKFEQGAEALYVVFDEELAENSKHIYGIITQDIVESAYKP